MAKRPGFQFRTSRAKMPKLNITVSSSSQVPSDMPSTQRGPAVAVPLPQQSEDMWPDDDDDELIMLASQAAEKVDAVAEMVFSETLGDKLNYDKFRKEVQSSTQLNKPTNELNDFMCVDEDVFADIPEYNVAPKPVSKPKPKPPANGVSDEVFAKPSTSLAVRNLQKAENLAPAPSTSSAATNHQQMEHTKIAAQNTFLSNKMRDQKKEIENLKEALAKVKETCQTKEGEASTLRYELEMNRLHCDRLRKEKMTELEQLEKNYVEKIASLQKIVEKQQTDIQFKNIEILNKKPRRSLNDTMPPPTAPVDREPIAKMKTFSLNQIAMLDSAQKSSAFASTSKRTIARAIGDFDFDPADGMSALSPKDGTILEYLNYLERMYNQVDDIKSVRIDAPPIQEISALVNELSALLHAYVQQLDFSRAKKYDASAERKHLSKTVSNDAAINRNSGRLRCFDDKPCVAGEKLIFERRLLAALALVCSECPSATLSLLDSPIDLNPADAGTANDAVQECFIDSLAILLTHIAFLKTSHLHKGLIEAASVLLTALASNYTPTEKRNTSLLNLFTAIVYCKPGIVALHQLTDFLSIASKQCCDKLCRGKSSDILNFPRFNIRRFSSDTCPLQVYAALLEVVFQPTVRSKSKSDFVEYLTILTQITIGLMTFLRTCFKQSVVWLFRRNDCGAESDSICYCYCYVVSATISLLHSCIKFWIEDQKCFELKTMEVILKMGALFLQDNFKMHYEPRVLQLGGVPIKNRLQVVYDHIVFFQTIFRFRKSHSNAIKSLDLRRKILMNEPQRVSPEMQRRSNEMENGTVDNIGGMVLAHTFEQFTI